MSLENPEKLSRVEELKAKLFSKNSPTIMEHRDTFSHASSLKVTDSWQKDEGRQSFFDRMFMRTPIFKKFFIFSIIFFLLAVGYAFYMIFFQGNTVSNNNIEIAVLGNTFTAGGEELSLVLEITNRNHTSLDLVDLVIEYPKDSSPGAVQDTERYRESLGSIPSGGVRSENVKLVLFGEQGSIRPIKMSLEYRVEGSNAIFVKERMYEVSIDSTPLNISINGPATASPNDDVVFEIKSTLNATKSATDVLMRVDYPAGFQFASAKPAPSFGNNIWSLGDLAPGAENTISITGRMLDVFEGEEKIFRIQSGSQSLSDKYSIETIFNSVAYTVAIEQPLLEARLFINGVHQREHAIGAKSKISGEIRWANNLETEINDFSIRMKLSGNALDRKSISSESGFYNSLQDEIVWDRNSVNEFREVNPGASGAVDFTLSPSSLFSSSGGLAQNPSIVLDISVSGKQPSDSFAVSDLTNQETATLKITSDVGFAAQALHFSGPFQNKGPIPPKAEIETTYTVVWTLSNTSNSISKAKITSSLPSWVNFIKTSSPDDLIYNPSTKELTWNIGTLSRGAGITGPGKEVSFQISFTPSLSQVGSTPVLVNDSVLTGTDDFANVSVRVNKASLNTRLSNDPSFPNNGDRVVE